MDSEKWLGKATFFALPICELLEKGFFRFLYVLLWWWNDATGDDDCVVWNTFLAMCPKSRAHNKYH
jgi:hypothetical protein